MPAPFGGRGEEARHLHPDLASLTGHLEGSSDEIVAEGEIRYYGWLSGFTLGEHIIRARGDVNSGMGQLIPLAGLDELVNGGTG